VTFDKSKGSLGLRLKSVEDTPGVVVLEKVDGTQAMEKDEVLVGDYVREINGQDADAMTHDQVIAAIVAAQGLVTIRFSSDAPTTVAEQVPSVTAVETKTVAAAAGAAAPRPSSGDHELSVVHDRDTTLVVVERSPSEGFGLRLGTFEEPGVQVR
jgi:C-terminal processing protease CtpA/Prc